MTRRLPTKLKADIPGSMLFKCQKTISQVCKHSGQAALELAIFGAIIIFVVGLIFSQALSSTHSMNVNLKAMRMALTESYRYSEQFNPSRNSAGVTIIEDRLAGTFDDKYGPIDRSPMVSSGAATMSKLLYYPVDWGEPLPTHDIIINGQRFPFVSSAYKTVSLPTTYVAGMPVCSAPHPEGWCWDVGCPAVESTSVVLEDCSNGIDDLGTDPAVDCADPSCNGSWECGGADGEVCNDLVDNDWDGFNNCSDRECLSDSSCNLLTTIVPGCVRLYKIVENGGGGWDAGCASCFDLDFDGVEDVPPADRADFRWQWQPESALHRSSIGAGTSINVDAVLPNGDMKAEFVRSTSPWGCIERDIVLWDKSVDSNITFSIDCAGYKIASINVVDSQDGDIDGTRDDSDPPPAPGLLDDAQMFSYTRDGTFLRIEEGELFSLADGRFVRNTTRKDHYDVIQRIFRVSNDTGRFCRADGSRPGTVEGLSNPVEVCNNCFTAVNVEQTCMDQAARLIYIRSRISNLGGRRWVTKKAPP